MSIGDRIKQLRTDLKLSQDEFASRLSVSRQAVYWWERGKYEPNDRMVLSISKIFGASYTWIKEGEGEMYNAITEQVLDDVKDMYGLNDLEMQVIRRFIKLPADERQAFLKTLQALVKEKEEA